MAFEDIQTTDFVQFLRMNDLPRDDDQFYYTSLPLMAGGSVLKTQMEVTARGLHYDGPPAGVPPISLAQDTALKSWGVDFRSYPNYVALIDLDNPDLIVDECEQDFAILGSSSDFEIGGTAE